MAPKGLKKRKRAARQATAEEAAPESPAAAVASEAAEEAAPEAAAPEAAPRKERRRGLRAASRRSKEGEAEEAEGQGEEEEAEKPTSIDLEKEDRRGIIHLASVPAFMSVAKCRYLMEKFGEVGRIFLAPEEKVYHERRKRTGGSKKVIFTEGWVEFAERKIARRVAETLNGGPIGGKKRHNFFRDSHWSMRYLPKFKWHQLKEGTIYARQVRKARLEQRLGQARRETNFYLEQVEQAKTKRKMAERKLKRKGVTAVEGEGRAAGEIPLKRRGGPKGTVPEEKWEMPDRMLESLIW